MKTPSKSRGVTLLELIVATAAGALVVTLLGTLYVRAAKNSRDMQTQADLQAKLKKANQLMTREITNTGAGIIIPDTCKLVTHSSGCDVYYPFTINSSQFQFFFLDLAGKHCAANSKVTMTYRLADTTNGKMLIKEYQCGSGSTVRQSMVITDSAALTFYYLKPNRTTTSNPVLVKMIQYDLTLFSKDKKKNYFTRSRLARVQVWLGAT